MPKVNFCLVIGCVTIVLIGLPKIGYGSNKKVFIALVGVGDSAECTISDTSPYAQWFEEDGCQQCAGC